MKLKKKKTSIGVQPHCAIESSRKPVEREFQFQRSLTQLLNAGELELYFACLQGTDNRRAGRESHIGSTVPH